MRDANRITLLMVKLGELWQRYCPDVRFGQLMYNFNHWHTGVHGSDIFFVEDDVLIVRFEEFLLATCGNPRRKT